MAETKTMNSSTSEPSNLKRKAAKSYELDEVVEIVKAIFTRIRTTNMLVPGEGQEWHNVLEEVIEFPELSVDPKDVVVSRCFTQASAVPSFFDEVFDEPGFVPVPSIPQPRIYAEAAESLRRNVLWKTVEEHVIVEEMACRSMIMLIVLTAIQLAQERLNREPDLDQALRERFKLESSTEGPTSWITLEQEVNILPQQVVPGKWVFHGILDHLFLVTSKSFIDARTGYLHPLTMDEAFPTSTRGVERVRKGGVAILEAKRDKTFQDAKSWDQVAAEGATLCILTQRSSAVNVLSDGKRWAFFQINKRGEERPQPARPFSYKRTRILDIYNDPNDLATVLRLLTNALVEAPEQSVDLIALPAEA